MELSNFLKSFFLLGLFFAIVIGGFIFSQLALKSNKKGTVMLKTETFTVEVADTSLKQMKGLFGRKELGVNEGMIFVFGKERSISMTMRGMLIPIDIIWIKDNKVIGFEREAKPEPRSSSAGIYPSPGAIDTVLEVKAGTVGRLGLQVGDQALINF